MAQDDLLLRPKVDVKALKTMSKKMEKSIKNAIAAGGKKAAKTVGKALRVALKGAAKAGGSAMHSAFQVGLGGALDLVKQMVDEVDNTLDRVEGRLRTAQETQRMAQSLGVDAVNLELLNRVGIRQGIELPDITNILQTFKETLAENQDFAGYKNLAENTPAGLIGALLSFINQDVRGKSDADATRNLLAAGIAGSDQLIVQRLAKSSIGGVKSLTDLAGLLDISKADLARIQAAQLVGNERLNQQAYKQYNQDQNQILKNGAAVDYVIGNNAQKHAQLIANENNLPELYQVRKNILEVERELQTALTSLIKYAGDIVRTFNKEGLSAALTDAWKPIQTQINSSLATLETNITDGIKKGLEKAGFGFLAQRIGKDTSDESKNSPKPVTVTTKTWGAGPL